MFVQKSLWCEKIGGTDKMGKDYTNCTVEEESEDYKKVTYNGVLKEIKVRTGKMFEIIFEDNAFVFVDNAHHYGWQKNVHYEIRIMVNKKNNTSQIFQINGNTMMK